MIFYFGVVENGYAFIASLLSSLGEYLEPSYVRRLWEKMCYENENIQIYSTQIGKNKMSL